MRGVTSEAKVLDYGVQIFETNEDVQFEEETFRSIGNFNLCGLILCASRISDARLLNFYHQCNLPIVLVNRYVKIHRFAALQLIITNRYSRLQRISST
jgi:DNA-binding LacI/PurR family transcriptional regulator